MSQASPTHSSNWTNRTGIDLTGIEAMPSRRRKGVMIAMPAFTHRRDGQPGDIVALDSGVLDEPVLVARGDARHGRYTSAW